MVCIYCSFPTQVINSRPQKHTNQIWRRRKCTKCGNVFTTHEVADLGSGLMVMSQNTLLPFDSDKLYISIYESLKHRPTALSDARALTQTAVAALLKAAQGGQLKREVIVLTVTRVLAHFDPAASAVYAAYHP